MPEASDAAAAILRNTIDLVGERIHFTYDFGDNWEVEIKLEKASSDDTTAASDFPRVLEGAVLGIIEDCGGVPGLGELVAAYYRTSGQAYDEYSDWLGMADLVWNLLI